MAYSGMPSKACANCRQRRIKCNLADPECAQCRRAGKVCPGYRDQLSLIFRDESAKVIRKACRRTTLAERQRQRGVVEVEGGLPGIGNAVARLPSPKDLAMSMNRIPHALTPSVSAALVSNHHIRAIVTSAGDPGVNFFLKQYMTASFPASSTQPDVYSSALWQGLSAYRPFLDAISCVGLAGLSNINHDPEMMMMARLKYAVTLRRVMTSLQVLDSADIGYTVKAVMLLTVFELVSCDPKYEGSWAVHVDGITALLSSNGFRQFEQIIDARIKLQFFFSLFIKYFQCGQKFPSPMLVWSRRWCGSLRQGDSALGPLAETITRFVDLHASIELGEESDASAIIRNALLLEADLEEWRATLPPSWIYTTEISLESEGTFKGFNGQYHLYDSHWVAKMWDHYRWTRILVHELILKHLALLPSTLAEKYEQQKRSLIIISHLASDICSSAWSQLNLPDLSTPRAAPQLTGVFMLLWPLRIAGSAMGVSDALHEWVIQVLENIGLIMGIRQTDVVIFKTRMHRQHWMSKTVFIVQDEV